MIARAPTRPRVRARLAAAVLGLKTLISAEVARLEPLARNASLPAAAPPFRK